MKFLFAALLALFFVVFAVSARRPLSRSLSFPSSLAAVNVTCYGEYGACLLTQVCSLTVAHCNSCKAGQYVCPLSSTCVNSLEELSNCPSLSGTHYDASLSTEDRLSYLVSQMNLGEKVSQMTNSAVEIPRLSVPSYNFLADDLHDIQYGHSFVAPDGCGLGATWDRNTLFDVGYAIGIEARSLHNTLVNEFGLRGTDGGAYQLEDGYTIYAPNINLVRDPRWGRAQETYGEDPTLTSSLAVSFIQGVQGRNESIYERYRLAGACAKHFAAYDVEDIPDDRTVENSIVNARNLWESYFPAFEASVKEGEVASIMPSYNAINGIPTAGDYNLLHVAFEQWNFTGFMIGDYDAWKNIYETHHYCDSMMCAAAVGLNAGMSQEGGGKVAVQAIPAAIAAGLTKESLVDEAVKRLFRIRIGLGMFDPPLKVPYNALSASADLDNSDEIALAQHAAEQSATLYKNTNDLLPLSNSSQSNIAIFGSLAVDGFNQLGNYAKASFPSDSGPITLFQGIFNYYYGLEQSYNPKRDPSGICTYESDISYFQPGQVSIPSWHESECCTICSAMLNCHYWTFISSDQLCYFNRNASTIPMKLSIGSGVISGSSITNFYGTSTRSIRYEPLCDSIVCSNQQLYEPAMELGDQSDILMISLGLDNTLEAEGNDRVTLDLPIAQYHLLHQLHLKYPQKPIVCVLIHGGTFAMKNLLTDCTSILDLWYPGMSGGPALARVLFGEVSPAGRSIATWYSGNDQLPSQMNEMNWYPNQTQGLLGYSYRYYTGQPDIPFGFGLSYTKFQYSQFRTMDFKYTEQDRIHYTPEDIVSSGIIPATMPTYDACEYIHITALVTNLMANNSNSIVSDEVTQLYIQQFNASVPVPYIRLANFTRTYNVATSARISLSIRPSTHISIYDGERQSPAMYKPERWIEQGYRRLIISSGLGMNNEQTLWVYIENTKNLDRDCY